MKTRKLSMVSASILASALLLSSPLTMAQSQNEDLLSEEELRELRLQVQEQRLKMTSDQITALMARIQTERQIEKNERQIEMAERFQEIADRLNLTAEQRETYKVIEKEMAIERQQRLTDRHAEMQKLRMQLLD